MRAGRACALCTNKQAGRLEVHVLHVHREPARPPPFLPSLARRVLPLSFGAMSDLHADASSVEEIANWARLLNHPHLERQTVAAEEISFRIGGEQERDEALLNGLVHHQDALRGLERLILDGDDEARQTACNLLFMLSMSEPERPFACSAHTANRSLLGAAPRIFYALATGGSQFAHTCSFSRPLRMLYHRCVHRVRISHHLLRFFEVFSC